MAAAQSDLTALVRRIAAVSRARRRKTRRGRSWRKPTWPRAVADANYRPRRGKSSTKRVPRSGPAHVAKKTKAFVAGLGGKLRLFYLPPYSPDRNPDELVWKHLKADTVGRASITSLDDFREKVKSSMLSLQRNPDKIRSFFHKPSLKYAA
jgi:transposase